MTSFYLTLVAIMSVISFTLYGIDKYKAKRGKLRISEKTLLLSSILLGATGGFIAMQLFRHKTRFEHWYFTFINIISIIIHIIIGVILSQSMWINC